MNFKELIQRLDEIFLNEMAPHITKLPFNDFKKEVIKRYEYKKERDALSKINKKLAEQKYPKLPYEDNCFAYLKKDILITSGCIEHVTKEHSNMNDDKWNEFLNTCNPSNDVKVKAKYDGRNGHRWIYKCKNEKNCFGYVLDVFEKSTPQIVTVFSDKESNVDNWIKNSINKKAENYLI